MHVLEVGSYLAILVLACNSYKILVYSPMLSKSHMLANGRVADELAKAGHQVVLFEPEFLPIADFNNSAYAQRIKVPGFSSILYDFMKSRNLFVKRSTLIRISFLNEWHEIMFILCKELLDMTEYLEKLRSYQFDIYIGEQLSFCGTGLVHLLGIKTHMWLSSCPLMDHMSWVLGVPMPPSYVPNVGSEISMSDKPSYMERFRNIIDSWISIACFRAGAVQITNLFRERYGNDFPDIDDIARNSSVNFILTDELVDFPRPITHNVVYIGGLGASNPKALKSPFTEYMKKGDKGVIFVSFGTVALTKNMPPTFVHNVVDAMRSFPEFHFIFKVDEGDQANAAVARAAPNVDVVEWAPQCDLLGHPRLKVFVTHGGYNSIIETARSGVPVVVVPGPIDQHRNGRVAERNGWGIVVNRFDLVESSESLKKALQKILTDDSYPKNAKRVAKLVKTKPFSAAERLLKYVEFVGSNDFRLPELQIEGRNLNFIVYYNLDIFIPFILLAILLLYFVWQLVRVFYRCFYNVIVEKLKTE